MPKYQHAQVLPAKIRAANRKAATELQVAAKEAEVEHQALQAAATAAQAGASGGGRARSGRKRNNKARRQRQSALRGFGRQAAGLDAAVMPRGNPADPRTTALFNALGRTAGGVQYVLRHLHPNGEGLVGGCKVPDGSFSASIALERRDEYQIGPPADATAGSSPWNLDILIFPLIYNRILLIRYMNLTALTNAYQNAVLYMAMDAMSSINDQSTGFSTPVYPTFKTQAVAGVTFEWSVARADAYGVIANANSLSPDAIKAMYRNVRRSFMGLTAELDAPALSDQGRIVAGQFGSDARLKMALAQYATVAETESPTPADVQNAELLHVELPPVIEEDVVQVDSLSYQGLAKDHVYMPMRTWKPTATPTDCDTAAPVLPTVQNAGSGLHAALQWPTEVAYLVDAQEIYFAEYGTGIIKFLQLSSNASVRLKVREGIEGAAAANSIISPFDSPGLPVDPVAHEFVSEFCRTNPHAYLGKYNSRNQMMRGIFGSIGNTLGALAKPLPLIGDLVGPLLGGIGNMLDSAIS